MSSRPDAGSTPFSTTQLQEFAGVQIGPERELLLEEDELEDELTFDDELLFVDDDEEPVELDDELLRDEDDDEEPVELDDELLRDEDELLLVGGSELLDELDKELLDDDDQPLEDELDDIAALLPNRSLNSSSNSHTQHHAVMIRTPAS